MRLTLIAAALLPMPLFAQEAQTQSCPTGMVWDGGLNACTIAETEATPAQSLPGGMGCSGHGATAREVTS